jgi:YndJ-like protein
LAGGPLVVAPLGLALAERVLHGAMPQRPSSVPSAAVGRVLRGVRRAQPVTAMLAAMALVLGTGTDAGLLALPWLGLCLVAGGCGLAVAWRAWRTPPDGPVHLRGTGRLLRAALDLGLARATAIAGLAYLPVGAAWLVASRFAWQPFGFGEDIVRLTGVHFHYAGFGLPVMAAVARDRAPGSRVLLAACWATFLGPPIVAAGFVTDLGVFQVGGAVVMTVAAWGVAVAALRAGAAAWRDGRPWPAALLVLSGLAPWAAMVLAVHWALGQYVDVGALGIDAMAATHGLLNGIGFVGAGLAGWFLLVRARGPSRPRPRVPA